MALDESFEDILDGAKKGAEWAWQTLYRELAGPLTGYLRNRGAQDPEDLAGEVFYQVARGIHGFTGDAPSFRSWVFVIAHRRLIDERRSRGRRPDLVPLAEEGNAEMEGGNVEAEAVDRLVTTELARAFSQLTDGQRDVLALRVIGNLTLEETAQVMGKRVGAVKGLQRRALESLQGKLDLQGVTR